MWGRTARWLKRLVLALLALIVVAILGVIVVIHTGAGREFVRAKLEAQLAALFVGRVTIAGLEGSPFGELVLRGVAIDGPDGKPAIAAGTLRARLRLFALLREHAAFDEVAADAVEVAVRRDANGRFEMARLLRPRKPEAEPSRSTWDVDLRSVEVRNAHVMVDTGSPDAGVVNLDGLAIAGNIHLPAQGARSAAARLTATWRERRAPVAIAASLSDDAVVVSVPRLQVHAGDVAVAASDVAITRRPGRVPLVAGAVEIDAPRAAVAALVPRIRLPADLALAIRAAAAPAQTVAVAGTLGATPVHVDATADLDARHVIGKLSTGDVDLASLTDGRVSATAGVVAEFDVMPGAPGEFPVATLHATGHGWLPGMPRSEFTIAASARGTRATTTLELTGAAKATVTAELARTAGALVLDRASVIASTRDPAKASGGKAPLHGSLDVALTAHGALSPHPELAVSGTVRGAQLQMKDLSAASLEVDIDATQLPAAPLGRARVRLADVVRGDLRLGAVAIDAANRSDGKIQVIVSSHPKQAPWLVELAALVTPAARAGGALIVDVQRHRIRAGNGVDWTGSTGRIVVAPDRIEVRELRSQSAEGKLAVAGTFAPRDGDATAKLDLDRFSLAALREGYAGMIGLHVDVARRAGRWIGEASASGKTIQLQPRGPAVDIEARLAAGPGKLTASGAASSKDLGTAKLALEIAAPARLDDAAAWKARGRDAIRMAQIRMQGIELARVVPGANIAGRVDGAIDVAATTASGAIHLRNVKSPALRGIRWIDADLGLAQAADGELAPSATVQVADVGTVTAQARLALPDHVFDPAAWKRLGPKLVRGATVRTGTVAIDPAMLDRFGIASKMRGRVRGSLDVRAGVSAVAFAAVIDELRGTPIAEPVSVHVDGSIDGEAATASLAMTSQDRPLTLVKLDGRIPVSLDELRRSPRDVKAWPIAAALELPRAPAPQLLNVFGRSEITQGTLDGKLTIGGTLGKPTVVAHIVGDHLGVPPGPRGKPVKVVKQITLDATLDGHGGELRLDGLEDRGKLSVLARGNPAALASATAKIEATAFDLGPILAFAPGPAGGLQGMLDANLAITGFDPRTAQIQGELHMRDARIPIAPTVGTLRQGNLDITIRRHDIALGVTGKLGTGDVKLDGTVALDGASLTGGQAKITLRKASPIGAVEPVIDADITAKLARSGTRWIADLVVDHGFVKVTTRSGEKLKPTGIPSDLVVGGARTAATQTGAAPPPKQPVIVANVILHDTKVESKEFRTTLRGKLTITADANTVGMVGEVAAQGGDLDLFDRRYRVDHALVNFDGTIDPRLDVRITHDFPEVTTITVVRGRLSNPQLELSSEPGTYSTSQLLGFLLGGEPGGDPTSGSARDKATSAGTSFIANQIGGYVKKALPFDLDVIRYEAASASSSAAITVGTWITHTLFFAFRQHLDARPDENSNEGTIEYWLTRRLEIEGTAGDRGYDGLDVLWRKRF